MTDTTLLTAQDLQELTKGHYELIEGILYEMSPVGDRHGLIESNITSILWNFVREHDLGRIKGGEVGFRTRKDEHTVRAADVAYTSYQRVPKGQTQSPFADVPPEIVFEVISPHDRATDIERKTQEWLDFGVLMVCNVYPDSQRVHVYHPQPIILSGDGVLEGGDILPGFAVKISEFFRD